MTQRGPIQLKLEILEAAQTPIASTRLMYATFTSYPVLQKYIAQLIDQGLLEKILPPPPRDRRCKPRGRTKYLFQTTEKGIEAIEQYKKLLELLT